MDNQRNNEEIEIDLLHLLRLLWKKAWVIVISTVLLGAVMFAYSVFFITPQYESTAMMYVNNSSLSLSSTSISISSSQLTAARSLLDTYVVILKTRTTFEKVIEKSGIERSYTELMSMVTAASVNDTDVFKITATSSDPAEAELIVDTIVEVLPERISDIVDGSSVRIVDHAILPTSRSSPSHTRNAIIGMILGFVLSAAAIVVVDMMDTSVRGEEYLTQRYSIPVLAVIPDSNAGKKHSKERYARGYYYSSSSHSEPSKRGGAET